MFALLPVVQCEELRKTKRHIEEKLAQSEGVIMSLQKENNKLQDDIFRLKSERTRLHNKVRVLSIGDCLIMSYYHRIVKLRRSCGVYRMSYKICLYNYYKSKNTPPEVQL